MNMLLILGTMFKYITVVEISGFTIRGALETCLWHYLSISLKLIEYVAVYAWWWYVHIITTFHENVLEQFTLNGIIMIADKRTNDNVFAYPEISPFLENDWIQSLCSWFFGFCCCYFLYFSISYHVHIVVSTLWSWMLHSAEDFNNDPVT